MSKLIIVSNRLPISASKRAGKLRYHSSVGGLATGLSSISKAGNSLWLGWPGLVSERLSSGQRSAIVRKLKSEACLSIFLNQKQYDNYYDGFCNRTIWPLFHYFTDYVEYNKNYWQSYLEVNRRFCDVIVKAASPDDTIWIHDYHLMLLPAMVREKIPEAKIGFFLHIPFPSYELFRLLPWRDEILKGLLGSDLVGFHTYDYVLYFLDGVQRSLGLTHDIGQVNVDQRVVRVDTFPMGIDYEKFANSCNNEDVKKAVNRYRKQIGDMKIVLSIDRLDYSKGIMNRLDAFDAFLTKYPKYRGKVTLILVAVPTRTTIDKYKSMKKIIDERIGRINGRHGTIGWVPIWYLYRVLQFDRLAALYNIADVCLVTPLRDGMNLIAKEYIASKHDGKGVLILSEMAGAVKELGESIIVNPNNREQVVDALNMAFLISEEDQVDSNQLMQKRLEQYTVQRWAEVFFNDLSKTRDMQDKMRSKQLVKEEKEKMIARYRKGKKRLIFLDYDGTLVPFADRPEKARPEKVLGLLKSLANDKNNEVVIISGRNKETLDEWFGSLGIGLIAEHGVWIKEPKGEWTLNEPMSDHWKPDIRRILEFYVDKTPRSFIEEKDYSLVWHYRRADMQLSALGARELKDDLLHLCENLNLGVLDGRKIIEIRNTGVNKGSAAFRWFSKGKWDFVMALGDDVTDEDIFEALPENAYSIKVGLERTLANYTLDSVQSVRNLLNELVR